jgi:hypothetical protein
LEALAQLLLREGHVDNEVDARLAAVAIILAHDALTADEEKPAG